MADIDTIQATLRCVVKDLSKLDTTILSPPVYVRNLPWRIMVEPKSEKEIQGQDVETRKSPGFYLKCDVESSRYWSFEVKADLKIIDQMHGCDSVVAKVDKVYNKESDESGFINFLSWAHFTSKGSHQG